jgi:hypothetical protein
MSTQRVVNRDENAAIRVSLALSLRAQKMPYAEVAKRCGYKSIGSCHDAVQRELQRTIVKNVDELRREELHMLDRLHALVWEQVVIPPDTDDNDDEVGGDKLNKKKKRAKPGVNLFAVDRVLAISERRCKLMALDKRPEEAEGNKVVVREVPAGWLQLPQATEGKS